MKTYKIGLIWQMYGYVEVEANSLAEAIHIVHSTDVPLPENGEYIEGSFDTGKVFPLFHLVRQSTLTLSAWICHLA